MGKEICATTILKIKLANLVAEHRLAHYSSNQTGEFNGIRIF